MVQWYSNGRWRRGQAQYEDPLASCCTVGRPEVRLCGRHEQVHLHLRVVRVRADAPKRAIVHIGPSVLQLQAAQYMWQLHAQLSIDLRNERACETSVQVCPNVSGLCFRPDRGLEEDIPQALQRLLRKKIVDHGDAMLTLQILALSLLQISSIADHLVSDGAARMHMDRPAMQAEKYCVVLLGFDHQIRIVLPVQFVPGDNEHLTEFGERQVIDVPLKIGIEDTLGHDVFELLDVALHLVRHDLRCHRPRRDVRRGRQRWQAAGRQELLAQLSQR
mmetsp:Transcript_100168/g.282641  ORF Transcript_100168/g.282641 Transcript_100168/m.282641 type:complete len:275 (-) Transcript_100168:464-1288(-)